MCGIAGFLRYRTKLDDATVNMVMRFLFPRILLLSEERGKDATGLYQVHANRDWTMLKTSRKVSDWVGVERAVSKDDPVLFDDVLETWDVHPSPLRVVVGHCRKATVGARGSNNDDNHPFAVQVDGTNAILGVHNGTLLNHDRIFDRLKELGSPLERTGKVDSEALFHLMYFAGDSGTRPWTLEDLYAVARKIDGSYATVTVNTRFPNQVAVMRDGRPMEMVAISPIGVMVLCSDKKFVEDALTNYNVFRKYNPNFGLPELRVDHRTILDRVGALFDLDVEFPAVPDFKTFEAALTKRDLNNLPNMLPDEEWRKPPSTTTTPPAATPPATAFPPATTLPPRQPVGALVPFGPGRTPTPPVDKTIRADLTLPEGEPGEEAHARSALPEARLIDLCPTYATRAELAQALGTTVTSLDRLSNHEVATKVAELSFIQGYAMASLDSERKVDRILTASQEQAQKLETTTNKWKKAQVLVWELKVLLIGVMASRGWPTDLDIIWPTVMKLSNNNHPRAATVMKLFNALTRDRMFEHARSNKTKGKTTH